MEDKTTIESIMAETKRRVENGIPTRPAEYLQNAAKINALLQDLDEAIVMVKSSMGLKVANLVRMGDSVSKAKVLVQGDDEYRLLLSLMAQRERAAEEIRIAKKMSETINYGA